MIQKKLVWLRGVDDLSASRVSPMVLRLLPFWFQSLYVYKSPFDFQLYIRSLFLVLVGHLLVFSNFLMYLLFNDIVKHLPIYNKISRGREIEQPRTMRKVGDHVTTGLHAWINSEETLGFLLTNLAD